MELRELAWLKCSYLHLSVQYIIEQILTVWLEWARYSAMGNKRSQQWSATAIYASEGAQNRFWRLDLRKSQAKGMKIVMQGWKDGPGG